MIFTETRLEGAFIIEQDKKHDERGFFARTFCQHEFAEHGLKTSIAQCNTSYNEHVHTLRGMHLQIPPHGETKLVRVTSGALYDVIIDLRRDSPTFKQWLAVELTSDNGRMLYIPEGFAHGFQTLAARTEVFYTMFDFYHAESQRGVRWNDPAFGIQWLEQLPQIISERDAHYPLFTEAGLD
ncbi:MAG: dTDP-4-dehydrorhamnose 3,5-epimerase [Anaerolineae bacterium]